MTSNAPKLDWIMKLLGSVGKNKKDLRSFLVDILSPGEIDDIYNRLKIIEELSKNGTPHRDVSKKFEVSISKVTRGANVLKYGSGIFNRLFPNKNNN